MTRERNTFSLKIRPVLLGLAGFPMFVPAVESVFLAQVGRWVDTSESDSEPDIFFLLISNIISAISDPSLPFSSSKWSAKHEVISTVFSSTSSTSWRGSSKHTLLSMNICLVLIFRSFNPLYYYIYPINKHSILCGFKSFLLSCGIRAHAVDPKSLKFDTSGLCPK